MPYPVTGEVFMADTSDTNPHLARSNFALLRVIAGLTVVYGNGLTLTGGPASAFWGAPLARFGLDFLFALSGYLVAGSWKRRPRPLFFFGRRLLRVLPGLAGCVLFTVAVIGPIATHMTPSQYALDSMTLDYLKNMVFVEQLWLPLVFQGQGWAGAVNPMLWTLLPGLLCCFALPASGLLSQNLRLWAFVGAAIFCATAALYRPLVSGFRFQPAYYQDILTEVPFFLVAALLRHLQDRMPGFWRADVAMLFFAGNWVVATWLGAWDIVFEWVSLPYMTGCFGHLSAPVLGRLGRWGNPSYGLYLYAFPIQQLIVARWTECPHPITACALLSVMAGYLSWHLIEQPALTGMGLDDRPPKLARAVMPPFTAQ